jgi:hypothetical protein
MRPYSQEGSGRKISQTLQMEGLLSDIFSCLSGRKIVALETEHVNDFVISESWSYLSFLSFGELAFCYKSSKTDHDLELYENGLNDLADRLGVQVKRLPSFGLVVPACERLYRFYENVEIKNACFQMLGSAHVACSGQILRHLGIIYEKNILQYVTKVRTDIVAIVTSNIEGLKKEDRLKCVIKLIAAKGKRSTVVVTKNNNNYEFTLNSAYEESNHLEVEVSLGAISMSLDEIVKLREGATITLPGTETFRGFLNLGLDSFAEVEIRMDNGEMVLEVQSILM